LLKALSQLFHRLAQSRPFVYFAPLAVAVVAYCVVNAYLFKQPGDKEGFAETVGQCVLLHTALRNPLGNEVLVTGQLYFRIFSLPRVLPDASVSFSPAALLSAP